MLSMDGVYVQDDSGHYAFRRTLPPTVEQLHDLLQVISRRVARFLERRGILERDEDNSYLTLDGLAEDPLKDIHGYSVTYRVAIGPQKGLPVRDIVNYWQSIRTIITVCTWNVELTSSLTYQYEVGQPLSY